jgi:cytidylate kinase
MIIAIDGPAGSGKSTVARAVAQRLHFTYLDSGAMYRCVGLAVLRLRAKAGGDDLEPGQVAESIKISLSEDHVLLDGEDVTEAIREPEVSQEASRVSVDPAVREAMTRKQRDFLEEGNWVAEGRDIGTVVAPSAPVKVFLTATPEARARRRAAELGMDLETVLKEQIRRDQRDTERKHSPLMPASDAVPVDTTDLTIEETVDQVVTLAVEAKELT